jgi:hypothetical protein
MNSSLKQTTSGLLPSTFYVERVARVTRKIPRTFFPDGEECSVDQEVHATAGQEAGATSSRRISTVQASRNRLYTNC